MTDEIDVVVDARTRLADDVVEFVLRPVAGGALPAWEPGAHIDVEVGDVDGDRLVRQYSLCGDPADRTAYRIAVLRQPAGRGGSAWLHDRVVVGDKLSVRGPRNHFPLEEAPGYLFLAGGIGITPLLAMARRVAAGRAEWSIHYGGRSRAAMAYREVLADVAGGRLTLVPQDESGLIDLTAALDAVPPGTVVYCCGPESLLAAAEAACAARGLRLRTERFAPKDVDPAAVDRAFTVTIASSGSEYFVPADRTIVDVLLAAGVDILTSCEEGTCGTCETTVVAGVPDHRDSVLTDEEQAAGDRLLPCVSRCLGSRLVLDL
ncbi:PDR/VanB family oxidoreductase [Pseudonocardia yuanmonensis]|uniref:PDR/VanB family oxidoreductase n=1 Tax=Pseudonocardia yuanmonensis TaxID=1095914 RepID=A0ABP8X0F0_9PSEU